MINSNDGSIKLKSMEFIIKPKITLEQFEESNLYNEVINEQRQIFSIFYLKPQVIGDRRFLITLCFNKHNVIDFINLSMLDRNEIPSWENWSEKDEKERNKAHAKWLKAQLGKPPYNYDWGVIMSYYDPRSGSSMINIRYK